MSVSPGYTGKQPIKPWLVSMLCANEVAELSAVVSVDGKTGKIVTILWNATIVGFHPNGERAFYQPLLFPQGQIMTAFSNILINSTSSHAFFGVDSGGNGESGWALHCFDLQFGQFVYSHLDPSMITGSTLALSSFGNSSTRGFVTLVGDGPTNKPLKAFAETTGDVLFDQVITDIEILLAEVLADRSGNIFVSNNGEVFRISVPKNKLVWKKNAEQGTAGKYSISERRNELVVIGGNWRSKIFAMNISTGDVTWHYKLESSCQYIVGRPVIDDHTGNIFITCGAYAISLDAMGKLRWKSGTGKAYSGFALVLTANKLFFIPGGQVRNPDDVVIHALHLDTGKPIGKLYKLHHPGFEGIIANGEVLVGYGYKKGSVTVSGTPMHVFG
eukprot:TRINITY_DN30906_c0_g1_i1.p1 TRINITY_DN30906_c0_g1~~TRINITY_DN30906_c0_g1_i1.p1  ORF type:complete len:432 (-),score=15.35 TRINITY_DN30906_c0_g1_i1:29-1189(-)